MTETQLTNQKLNTKNTDVHSTHAKIDTHTKK